MIDYGLLVSMIIAFGIPALVSNWWLINGRDEPVGFLDVAVGPAFAGLVVGRLTTLAFDDPSSIGSISDMLIIRSGVEFWPGVAAALGAAIVSANLGLVPIGRRIADLAPHAMIGYAAYEAACLFRDGCYGPKSPIGLRPPGLSTTMVPVGWFMAAAVIAAAVGVHTLVVRRHSPHLIVSTAALAVAAVRAAGSIWLPHVGDGLTRQHVTSNAMTVIAAIATAIALTRNVQHPAPGTPPAPA